MQTVNESSAGRKRLPDRRSHEIINFHHNGFAYVAGVGRYEDGRAAEIFLNAEKIGTAIETQARDAAITALLYFQHGGTLETLRRALTRNGDGSASGPLGAALDLLAGADGSAAGRLARALGVDDANPWQGGRSSDEPGPQDGEPV